MILVAFCALIDSWRHIFATVRVSCCSTKPSVLPETSTATAALISAKSTPGLPSPASFGVLIFDKTISGLFVLRTLLIPQCQYGKGQGKAEQDRVKQGKANRVSSPSVAAWWLVAQMQSMVARIEQGLWHFYLINYLQMFEGSQGEVDELYKISHKCNINPITVG